MAFHPRDEFRSGELELFAKKFALVVGALLALAILWFVREVVLLVFIAACLAAGISPAVYRVRTMFRLYFHRRVRRGTAVVLVYFPFVITAVVLLVVMVPRFIADTRALSAQLPQLLEANVFGPLGHYVPMDAARELVKDGLTLPRASVFGVVRTAATAIASAVAVLFMVVYMLIDAHRLRNLILLFYPPEVRAERRQMLNRMAARMSSWLSAQLILSAIIGATTFVTLLALRLPYALPLAIFATVGEMVPVIGPIVGYTPALLIAILHSRWQFWSLLAVAVLMQKLENLFIAPRIMARKVSISPLAVFIAFMSGAALLGIVGAIIAIPVAAITQVIFEEAFVVHRERRLDRVRAGTLTRRA